MNWENAVGLLCRMALLALSALVFLAGPLGASEVQKHGLSFERWVADTFFGGHRAAGPTEKWDIPASANKNHGNVPVNPKAAAYGQSVGLGDALRQYDIDGPFLLVIGFWEQDGDNKKFVKSLAALITPEQWRKLWFPVTRDRLEELDRLVKDTSSPIVDVRKEALLIKKLPPFSEAVIQVNPKIDKSQRRLQCSISYARLFEHLAPGTDPGRVQQPEVFGMPIPVILASPKRDLPEGAQ